ncbi:heme exporter protein CcmD [Xanthobacter dioxanivorans]|uniref:Heme exporter protein D n=1 Tax=Xanthobacter dioxanivorans TaxID=2528964 RepID=A0A974SIN1_9HYPH|nr:heme exporter protein CcmD [Xanthobacter dioxanivorans]QRG06607.1 heme exporter protein CcmD [Xanthobacter dioxanivorans]
MTHFLYISASYGIALLGLGGLAAWLLADYAQQRRALTELEARGIGRRPTSVGGGEA